MSGQELIEALSIATGLPANIVQNELSKLIDSHGLDKETISLAQLREILASYMQDVLVEAKEHHSTSNN